jgi:hypothetical protein
VLDVAAEGGDHLRKLRGEGAEERRWRKFGHGREPAVMIVTAMGGRIANWDGGFRVRVTLARKNGPSSTGEAAA